MANRLSLLLFLCFHSQPCSTANEGLLRSPHLTCQVLIKHKQLPPTNNCRQNNRGGEIEAWTETVTISLTPTRLSVGAKRFSHRNRNAPLMRQPDDSAEVCYSEHLNYGQTNWVKAFQIKIHRGIWDSFTFRPDASFPNKCWGDSENGQVQSIQTLCDLNISQLILDNDIILHSCILHLQQNETRVGSPWTLSRVWQHLILHALVLFSCN